MQFTRFMITIGAIAILSGCATKSVLVIDNFKTPVREATVEPVTQSMNLPIQITDEYGIVTLPHSVQKIEWISVRKEGFQPSGQIAVKLKGQTTVVLQPSK